MSNNQRRAQRKIEIKHLREDGAAAFRAGKSRQSNPHRDANEPHWRLGWDLEQEAEQRAQDEAVTARDPLTIAEHAFRHAYDRGHSLGFNDGDPDPDGAWADYAKLITVTV